jgi:hypothetical protein
MIVTHLKEAKAKIEAEKSGKVAATKELVMRERVLPYNADIDKAREEGWWSGEGKDKVILEIMKANSKAWHTASDAMKEVFEMENKMWAEMLHLVPEESTGRWKNLDGTYAYANGTNNAKKGVGLYDEEGLGSEIILENGVLKQFNGGERVFSAEMADRLWEMAQQNYTFTPPVVQANFGNLTPIEERISNAVNSSISNISSAFGDTYMINDVQLNESEGGTLKGFMDFLKKKI